MRSSVSILMFPLLLAAQRGGPGMAGWQRPGGASGAQGGTQGLQAAQVAAVKPEDFCTVAGQVVNAVTGEPLGKATVRLRRADAFPGGGGGPRAYTAGSDSNGQFVLKNVPPGKYRISATRTGFVDAEYGSRDPQRAGTVVSLDARQHRAGIDFRMVPHGVVTGRIVDQDGEPVEGLDVQAYRYRYMQGRKQLVAYGNDTTNDIGEYRVYGLPPGRYFVGASPRRNFGPGSPTVAADRPEEEYVTTWYPGSTESAAAAPVEIFAGAQLRGLDIRMARRHTVRVSGRVTDASGSGRGRTMVFLASAQDGAPGGMRRAGGVNPNGEFEIRGVAPGAYILVAGVAGRGQGAMARMPVQVGNHDLAGVSITINPPLTVTGRVHIDGQNPAPLTGIQATLRSREPAAPMFGAPSAVRVKDDGSFTVSNVNPDLYSLVLSGLPDGHYVKAVTANGQDMLGPGLDLNRGAPAEIDVLLSPAAGLASGLVENNEQQPTAGVTVVAVPQERERQFQPQYYRTATTDDTGRFTLKNLDPGSYKVYAWEEVESGAYMDPDFRQPFENSAQSLTIRENSREDLKVKLAK